MMKKFTLLTILLCTYFTFSLTAQERPLSASDSVFSRWGEIYFKFQISSRAEMEQLTKIISVDDYRDQMVYAYATKDQFEQFKSFGYPFEILPNPGGLLSEKDLSPVQDEKTGRGTATWNFYPTYQQYVDTMHYYAAAYPDLCRLDTIGTSIQGRMILALKISDNVTTEEAEPEFLYTSSIHGDETTGYVLMLHLIDSLVSSYGVSERLTNMVDNTEIYINPLANPDGTYHGGNNSVSGAQRDNANGFDLNRNFACPAGGNTSPRQKETTAFMNFSGAHHFVMGANFHGGSEVFNYPWDCWARRPADNNWWIHAGREYADTVHKYSPSGYFIDMNNGVTNGWDWYDIYGGRQDYMNYYRACREVTIEISVTKLLPANQLLNLWKYNKRSLLNYLERVNYGFQGVVTDTVTGDPIDSVKVNIASLDKDNSWVYSKLPGGFYDRPIYPGTYDVTFSATGYFPKTLPVEITDYTTTILDVQLRPVTYGLDGASMVISGMVYPNPCRELVTLTIPWNDGGAVDLVLLNSLGKEVFLERTVPAKNQGEITINIGSNPAGVYLLKISHAGKTWIQKLLVR